MARTSALYKKNKTKKMGWGGGERFEKYLQVTGLTQKCSPLCSTLTLHVNFPVLSLHCDNNITFTIPNVLTGQT